MLSIDMCENPPHFSCVMGNNFSECGSTMTGLSNHSKQVLNHSYTVELRFTGDSLVPSEITRQLCLQPTNSSDSLTVSVKDRKRRPFWAYNGQSEDKFQSEWLSLEQGFEFLLRHLAPCKAAVIEISQGFEGIWWCGHFQCSFDGGPTLSSEILAEIADYGLPLFIDNYFAAE